MRIRKKAPNPHPSKPPLYLIGYSFSAPGIEELRIWYDLEYGGPLRLREDEHSGGFSASHGPWHARLRIGVPAGEASPLVDHLVWNHRAVGTVTPASAKASDVMDTILFAARLARGLTLLTQGTTFDSITCHYWNPSDWNDRSLTSFRPGDHIEVVHADSDETGREWYHTVGLSKFGIDELELFRPQGLSTAPAIEELLTVADELLHRGCAPKLGTSLEVEALGRTALVLNHRTVEKAGRRLVLRQIELS